LSFPKDNGENTLKTETADIAIKGGICVNSREMRKADIFIKDGLIDSIESGDSARPALKVIDASEKFVLPGIIDVHLHPVYADRIDTLSKAAVYGGITTLIPYVGAVKAWGKTGTILDAVKDFIEEGEKNSVVDFGIHCTLTQDDMEQMVAMIPRVVEMGVTSFKAFMAYARRGMKLEDDELLRSMETIAKNGALFAVHAENGGILDYLEDKFIAERNVSPEYYPYTHPNLAEAEAIFRILTLAKTVKCPLYLPHVSAHESLEVIRLFKGWGEPEFFTETCTHYLTLTDEEMKKRGSLAKMAPSLRKRRDIDEIWKAIDERLIDVVGSDAAGHLIKDKEPLWDDVFKSPYGIPGVDTMFAVAYDEGVNKERISLSRLVELTCERPAKIFGLYPKKGVLEKGSDADVVIFDPRISFTIKGKNPQLKVDYSMYEERICSGAPTLVIQRGQILMEDSELKVEPGQGKFIPRKKFEHLQDGREQ
jgi:dihydropyrimidinase